MTKRQRPSERFAHRPPINRSSSVPAQRSAPLHSTARIGPGWSALHYAATAPDELTLQKLLERGAAVDARSPNGTTPLMMAAQYGPEDAVLALLKQGADARLRNDLDLGAADFARRVGRESLAEKLAAAAR